MAGLWRKTLMYLGLVEDDEDLDLEYGYDDLAEEEPAPRRSSSSLRRVAEPVQPERRDAVVRAIPTNVSAPGVHHLSPTNFNTHAQELGDKFRDGAVVIMNLDDCPDDEASRLKNFASGLVYGLRGSMRQVGRNVFLLSPEGVAVSAEEQQRLLDARGLFNQA
jgi:cell division inhibitor SepF